MTMFDEDIFQADRFELRATPRVPEPHRPMVRGGGGETHSPDDQPQTLAAILLWEVGGTRTELLQVIHQLRWHAPSY
jgi:hypothetical protein